MDPVLAPGDVCGGHRVIRLLGSGGFAQVYEVEAPGGARRALKILDAEADAKPKVRARLAQEGAALTVLDHANVVRLFDAGVDGDRIYLILELVEGKSLREVLRARPPVATVVRWIRQAAEGVAEAHRRGIVHRDLKPENLLVTSQDVVKVIDFGIAKLTGWGVRTTQEQKLGTALYMPPEQIQGKEPSPRMDVYALGLILYEALAGAHPIAPNPTSVYQICALQLGHRPRPLLEVVPGLPPELGAVVDQAIEKDPARRTPDMRAFAEGLHAALLRLGEERHAALRGLVASPGAPASRPRLPPTVAMQAMDPVSSRATGAGSPASRPVPNLAQTAPLGGELPFAVTAAIRTGAEVTGSAPVSAPASVLVAPAPPSAQPAQRNQGLGVAVVVAVVMVLVGGGLLALRIFGSPF